MLITRDSGQHAISMRCTDESEKRLCNAKDLQRQNKLTRPAHELYYLMQINYI